MHDSTEAIDESKNIDRAGIVASTVCAAHCGISAVLPLTGALGLSVFFSHEAEWIATLVAFAFAGLAAVFAYRRNGSRLAIALLIVGMVALLGVRMSEGGHEDHHHSSEHDDSSAAHQEHDEAHHHAEKHHAKEDHGDEHLAHADDAHARRNDEHRADAHERPADADRENKGHAEHGHEENPAGILFGFGAGIILISGHLLNLRESRRQNSA